ncbi:MAG: DUF2148 domain-containing protein [Acidobacteriota bacterium]
MPSIHTKEFPWYSDSDKNRRDRVLSAAELMMSAAHSAPVTGGVDHLETELVWGEKELNQLADKMDELSYLPENRRADEIFRTEAQMVRESDCVLALGSFRARNMPFDANCGMCGGPTGCGFVYSRRRAVAGQIDHSDKSLCKTTIDGPLCQMYVHNLGYGVGSALWTARTLLVDARPFMTVGAAASRLGYCRNSAMVIGILVASTSKNAFVDIPYNYHLVNMRRIVESVQQAFMIPRQFGLDYRIHPLKKARGSGEE